jgi:hypothetical protein
MSFDYHKTICTFNLENKEPQIIFLAQRHRTTPDSSELKKNYDLIAKIARKGDLLVVEDPRKHLDVKTEYKIIGCDLLERTKKLSDIIDVHFLKLAILANQTQSETARYKQALFEFKSFTGFNFIPNLPPIQHKEQCERAIELLKEKIFVTLEESWIPLSQHLIKCLKENKGQRIFVLYGERHLRHKGNSSKQRTAVSLLHKFLVQEKIPAIILKSVLVRSHEP